MKIDIISIQYNNAGDIYDIIAIIIPKRLQLQMKDSNFSSSVLETLFSRGGLQNDSMIDEFINCVTSWIGCGIKWIDVSILCVKRDRSMVSIRDGINVGWAKQWIDCAMNLLCASCTWSWVILYLNSDRTLVWV